MADFEYSLNYWEAQTGTGLNKFYDSISGNTLELTQTPDSITQAGTPFSAAWMNALEQWVAKTSYGTWTPAVNCISTPTAASGWYQKVGNVVTIGWFITGSVDSIASTAIRITGIPFTPDSSVRWYGGGGNVTALSTAAYDAFCGYTLDTASDNEILIRTAPTGTTAGVRTSGYVTANSAAQGNTAFISGTLTYMTND